MSIDATAMIDPAAELDENVQVGAYSRIGPGVRIAAGCSIGSHVVIARNTRIGRDCRIYQFASVGEDPQDKKYAGEETLLEIGERNVIREFVTLNRGTVQDEGVTRIGSDNLFMAYTHVAHDCRVGDHVIMANGASLGGHVEIQDWAILGGFAMVHQFSRIGAHSFAAMGSAIGKDVPPFVRVAGQPARPRGINVEGMKRRGFSAVEVATVKQAYRLLYRSGKTLDEAVSDLTEMAAGQPVLTDFTRFLSDRVRSVVR